MDRKRIGQIGEDIAAQYLIEKGFRIIERNYQKRIGEIDIVTMIKNVIVFFEVKTTSAAYSSTFLPEQHVNAQKANKLRKICEYYLSEKRYGLDWQWRIDVIGVTINTDKKRAYVRHFENQIFEC